MLIETQAVGPFFKNGFVAGCEKTREAVLIDPGDEVEALLAYAERNTLRIGRILLTHAHVDHVTGVAAAKRALDVPVHLRRGDRGMDLFVGDTLFAGSIGRTDLPGGDFNTLIASIRKVLFAFGDDAVVYPGHGPTTTIGRERKTNPFLQAQE